MFNIGSQKVWHAHVLSNIFHLAESRVSRFLTFGLVLLKHAISSWAGLLLFTFCFE
jgi:hypothetical protein